MEITTTHMTRCGLVALKGRFDSNTTPALEEALRASLDADKFRIVVDMNEVEYFGSAAIRALIMAHRECCRWNRGDVRLARVPERIRHILDITGITPLFQVFDDDVMAVGSF